MTQQAPAGRGTGPASPSAATVLEVADGLRWQDPNLSAALAEHAVRLAGDDAALRGAAERSALRALGELDQPGAVVARAVPQLEAAVTDRRSADAVALRCLLVGAALQSGDATAARGLLDAALAEVSSRSAPELRGELELRTAQVLAVEADVPGADAAARRAQAAVSRAAGAQPSSASALDLLRARAAARRASGDVAGAVVLLGAASTGVPEADPDGGRRALLVIVDLVSALLDLGDTAGARAHATELLTRTPGPTTALPLGQLRCSVAGRIHLPARELDAADAVARTAEADLCARGHDAAAAIACEIVASVAEARGDLAAALAAVRRAHALEMRAVDEQHRVRRALAAVLVVTAAASPPVRERLSSAAPEIARNGAHASGSIACGASPVTPSRAEAEAGTAPEVGTAPEDARLSDGERAATTDPAAHPGGMSGGGATPAVPADGAAPEEDAEVLAALEDAVTAAGIRRGGRRRRSETADGRPPAGGSSAITGGAGSSGDGRSSLFDTFSAGPRPDALDLPGAEPEGGAELQEPGTTGGSAPGVGPPAPHGPDGHGSTDQHADGAGRNTLDGSGAGGAGAATSRYRDDTVDREGGRGLVEGARADTAGRADDEREARAAPAPRDPAVDDEPWWRRAGERASGGNPAADVGDRRPGLEPSGTVDGEDPLSAPVSWGLAVGRGEQERTVPRVVRGGDRASGAVDRPDAPGPSGDERRSGFDPRAATRRGRAVGAPDVRGGDRRGDDRDPLHDPEPVARREDAAGLDAPGDAAVQERFERGVGDARRNGGEEPGPTTATRGSCPDRTGTDTGRNGRAATGQLTVADGPARDRRPDPGDEEAEDLALTLAGLLAEYDVPIGSNPAPSAAHPASARPRGDSGSSSGFDGRGGGARPGDGRPEVGADAGSSGAGHPARPGPARSSGPEPGDRSPGAGPGGRGAGSDSGARLADLLAEAMDAFRRTGPGHDGRADRSVMPGG